MRLWRLKMMHRGHLVSVCICLATPPLLTQPHTRNRTGALHNMHSQPLHKLNLAETCRTWYTQKEHASPDQTSVLNICSQLLLMQPRRQTRS